MSIDRDAAPFLPSDEDFDAAHEDALQDDLARDLQTIAALIRKRADAITVICRDQDTEYRITTVEDNSAELHLSFILHLTSIGFGLPFLPEGK